MKIQSIESLLSSQAFFSGLPDACMTNVAGCGKNEIFAADKFLARAGQPAEQFFVIRSGQIAIEIHASGRSLRVQTAGAGEVVGWSWLFPPHQWTFDVHALEETHVIALDGKCLRNKCESDPVLGYQLMKRFAGILVQRLSATRLQLLDVYGSREKGAFG